MTKFRVQTPNTFAGGARERRKVRFLPEAFRERGRASHRDRARKFLNHPRFLSPRSPSRRSALRNEKSIFVASARAAAAEGGRGRSTRESRCVTRVSSARPLVSAALGPSSNFISMGTRSPPHRRHLIAPRYVTFDASSRRESRMNCIPAHLQNRLEQRIFSVRLVFPFGPVDICDSAGLTHLQM